MKKPLFQRYKEAEKDGDIYGLIEELTDEEIFQLYHITGNEILGEEIDRLKGKRWIIWQ